MHSDINYWCATDVGRIRSDNEDNLYCDGVFLSNAQATQGYKSCGSLKNDTPRLFAIFDGMGGEACGEVASFIGASTAANADITNTDGVYALRKICYDANKKICEYASENSIRSMGSTAAMLLFGKKNITLCNIGDSKVFWIADGQIEQISVDHVIELGENKKAPLLQCLGIPPEEMIIDPYVSLGEYEDGDRFIICSDGLTDMVADTEIADIVENNAADPAVALVDKALKNGGHDNVTVIVIQINKKHF